MPELPDVEATRRYLLNSGLAGRSVRNVELFWSRAVRTPGIEDFVLTLCGQRIEAWDAEPSSCCSPWIKVGHL